MSVSLFDSSHYNSCIVSPAVPKLTPGTAGGGRKGSIGLTGGGVRDGNYKGTLLPRPGLLSSCHMSPDRESNIDEGDNVNAILYNVYTHMWVQLSSASYHGRRDTHTQEYM